MILQGGGIVPGIENEFVIHQKAVAITFAGMTMDAVKEGKTGLMTAISSGCYAMVPIPNPKLGPRKVDIATMYNTERYRPTYDLKLGLPIFLARG